MNYIEETQKNIDAQTSDFKTWLYSLNAVELYDSKHLIVGYFKGSMEGVVESVDRRARESCAQRGVEESEGNATVK